VPSRRKIICRWRRAIFEGRVEALKGVGWLGLDDRCRTALDFTHRVSARLMFQARYSQRAAQGPMVDTHVISPETKTLNRFDLFNHITLFTYVTYVREQPRIK
jgi:hypothetical protein